MASARQGMALGAGLELRAAGEHRASYDEAWSELQRRQECQEQRTAPGQRVAARGRPLLRRIEESCPSEAPWFFFLQSYLLIARAHGQVLRWVVSLTSEG